MTESGVSKNVQRAGALLDMGRAEDAVQQLQRERAAAPNDVWLLSNMALALWRAGRDVESLAAAEDAVAASPEYAWAHRLRAKALGSLGRHDDAVSALEVAISVDPENPYGWSSLSDYLVSAGRYADAQRAAEQALALAPADFLVVFAAARSAPDFEQSAGLYRKALAIEPGHAMAHANLGLALLHLGSDVEAESSFRQALAIDPANVYARRNLPRALYSQGRVDEAAKLERQAMEDELADLEREFARDGRAVALANQAEPLVRLGRKREALRVANEATRREPRSAYVWRTLAWVRYDSGHNIGALKASRKAVALDPQSVKALAGYARHAAVAGRAAEAACAVERMQSLAEDDDNTLLATAIVAACEGRHGEAEKLLYTAESRWPSGCDIQVWLGICRSAVGDLGGAAERYANWQRLNPNCGCQHALRLAEALGRDR